MQRADLYLQLLSLFEFNQQRMHAENLKNNTALQKWKSDSPLYLEENRLDIFQAQPDTINGYRTLPNATEHDFSDRRIKVTLNSSLSKPWRHRQEARV